jgi:CheY-like chemotaxis protein
MILVKLPAVTPTILVIEDNSADVVLLRIGLDQVGEPYQLQVLEDGEAAMRFVNDHRNGVRPPHPCVIVMDLHLPRYNGVEILHAIRQAPALAHIQVVVLTSMASPSEEEEIKALGGMCLQKPSDLDLYSKLAEEVLELCKDASAAMA